MAIEICSLLRFQIFPSSLNVTLWIIIHIWFAVLGHWCPCGQCPLKQNTVISKRLCMTLGVGDIAKIFYHGMCNFISRYSNCSVNSIKKWFKITIPYFIITLDYFLLLFGTSIQTKTTVSHKTTLCHTECLWQKTIPNSSDSEVLLLLSFLDRWMRHTSFGFHSTALRASFLSGKRGYSYFHLQRWPSCVTVCII